MPITRRNFLKLAVPASLLTIPGDQPKPHKPETVIGNNTDFSETTLGKLASPVLNKLNPTVLQAVAGLFSQASGVGHIINQNLEAYQEDKLNLENLRYNNADKFAGILLEMAVFVLPALARLPVDIFMNKPEHSTKEKKEVSDITNVTAFHGQSLLYVYLYNPFQSALRKIYIDILGKHPEYNNDPRKVAPRTVIDEIRKQAAEQKPLSAEEQKLQTAAYMRVLKYLSTAEQKDKVTLPYAIKRDFERCFTKRGVLDLLSLSLSYPVTLLSNFGLGQAVAMPHRFALYTRDMLERIEKQKLGPEAAKEEFQSALSYFANTTASCAYQGLIQKGIDLCFGLNQYSKDNLAAVNLRELIGAIIGWKVYYGIQAKLEPRMRRQVEANPRPLAIKLAHDYLAP